MRLLRILKVKIYRSKVLYLIILFLSLAGIYFISEKGIICLRNYFNNKKLSELYNKIYIEIPVKYEFDFEDSVEILKIKDVSVTAYCNRVEETDSTPNLTATGRIVCEGMVAVSQDLFRKSINPGEIIYLTKLNKYFIVDDTMNQRHTKSVDIFMHRSRLKDVKKFGKIKSDMIVIKVNK